MTFIQLFLKLFISIGVNTGGENMARILYGLSGGGRGHTMRALAIARHFKEHEFVFLSQGTGSAVLKEEFDVRTIPNPSSPVQAHRVNVTQSMIHTLKVLGTGGHHLNRLFGLIEEFKPDAAITDYEYFVPRACRKMGIPCLSIDHQHIVTCCRISVPMREMSSFLGAFFAARTLYNQASLSLVVSFFHPPLRSGSRARLVPPLLRQEALTLESQTGDHVVAYQGYQTFKHFLPFLKEIRRPVMVYGFDLDHRDKNLQFRKFSEGKMLADLASCSYVVCGGGHTLISESLYFGKPILSFPVKGMFEQFLNALYVEKLGYGQCHTDLQPKPEVIRSFESNLERYRNTIGKGNFCGNQEVFDLIEKFVKDSIQ